MPRSTAGTFHVNSQDQLNKKPRQDNTEGKRKHQCVFCKGPHTAHNCDIVTDYQKRFEIIKGGNLYFKCLAHHRVSQWPSKFRCTKCKKKHHTSLCNSDPHSRSDGSSVEGKTPETIPTTTAGLLTPMSHRKAPQNTTCLLKTAVAPIIAGNTKSQANILFDKGAQRSFISAEMANELQITPTSTVDIAVVSFSTTSTTSQTLRVTMVEIWQTNSHISFNCAIDHSPYPEFSFDICLQYATSTRLEACPSHHIWEEFYRIAPNWNRLLLELRRRPHH